MMPDRPARIAVILLAFAIAAYIGAGLTLATVWLGLWTPEIEVME